MLYIGTGDAAVGTNPQNLKSLGGKVLRIRSDGYDPEDQPVLLPRWQGAVRLDVRAPQRPGPDVPAEQRPAVDAPSTGRPGTTR